MTIKHLLISTTLLAVSIFLVTVDQFSSLLTLIAIYIGVATIFHAIAINFASHSLRKTLGSSLAPAFTLTLCLSFVLSGHYPSLGWMAQLTAVGAVVLLLAIVYVLFARILDGL